MKNSKTTMLACGALAALTAGCGSTQAMRDAVYGPKLSPVSDPTAIAAPAAVAMPMSLPEPSSTTGRASSRVCRKSRATLLRSSSGLRLWYERVMMSFMRMAKPSSITK